MIKARALLLLLCTLMTSHFLYCQETRYFQQLNMRDGLSQQHVIDIEQDKEGFLWFATKGGLNRYDGNSIQIFDADHDNPNSLTSSRLTGVKTDDKGRIWVSAEGGDLCWYDPKTEKFQVYKTQFEGKEDFTLYGTRKLSVKDNGAEIWGIGDEGLFKINSSTLELEFFGEAFIKEKNAALMSLYIGKKNVYVGAYGQGLFVLDEKGNISSNLSEECKNVSAIVEDKEGGVWIGTTYGLYKASVNKENHFELMSLPFLYTEGLQKNRIMSLSLDKENRVWIGTENDGIYIYDPSTNVLSNYKNEAQNKYSLSNNSVYSLFEDNAGRMWIGTFNQGLSFWDKHSMKMNIFRNGLDQMLPNNTVRTFYAESQNKIWIGTDGGGMGLWNKANNTYHLYNKANTKGFTSDAVLSIKKDSKSDAIWVGTWAGALMKITEDGQLKTPFDFKTKGVMPFHIFDIKVEENGDLWLVDFFQGPCYFDVSENIIHSIIPENGEVKMSSRMCTAILKRDNQIWIGTATGGINRLDLRSDNPYDFDFKIYAEEKKYGEYLRDNFIQKLLVDSKNRVWALGPEELYLYVDKEDKFEIFNIKDGLPRGEMASMEEGKDGFLWVSSNDGIYRFDPVAKKAELFEPIDVLGESYFAQSSSVVLPSGEILFGGGKGHYTVNTKHIVFNDEKLKMYLTDLKLFNQRIDIGENSILSEPLIYMDEIEFDHEQSVFEIDYVGVGFTHPYKNQYAYKLVGFDKQWNYVGSQTSANYTNLDPGQYIFKVKGANNDGVWAESEGLKITVLPPWWETWWFRAIFLTLIVISSYTFYRVRINMLKRQKLHLEGVVTERTRELVEKQAEISTQNEELLQQSEEISAQRDALMINEKKLSEALRQVTSSIRYAQTIQEALLPSPSRLNEMFQKSFVIYEPKDIVSGDFYWSTEIEGYKFMAVIDCTGHGVPGAFMSMIGNTLLNRIIKEKKVFETDDILRQLNIGIYNSLRQETSKNQDGMDAAIIRLSESDGQYEIQFSGAKNPVYIFRKDKEFDCEVIQGTRKSIGGTFYRNAKYDKKMIDLNEGDLVVLSSDGIIDMKNTKGVKVGTPNFVEFVRKNASDIDKLKQYLANEINENKEAYPPRDDIAIVGVRV